MHYKQLFQWSCVKTKCVLLRQLAIVTETVARGVQEVGILGGGTRLSRLFHVALDEVITFVAG